MRLIWARHVPMWRGDDAIGGRGVREGGWEESGPVSFLHSAPSMRNKPAFNEGRSAKWPSRVRQGQGGHGSPCVGNI